MKKILIFSAAILVLSFFTSFTAKASVGDTITLDLTKPLNPEDSFKFVEPGRWDLTYDSTFTMFEAQIFGFSHLTSLMSYNGTYWEGFTVCNTGDTAYYGYANAWGNMAGGGIKTDANGNIVKNDNNIVVEKRLPYIVAYYDAYTDKSLKVTLKDTTYMPLGVYIANSPYPYYENINGGSMAQALDSAGDFFKLTFHGLDPDNEETGTTVEHFLAKFEDGVLKQSNKWEWVDLSALGKVSSFYCTLSSSDNGQFGMNTAAYFCMDKLQVVKPQFVRNEYTVENAKQVKVYPTVTSDILYISTANNFAANNKAVIYDLQGRKLQEASLPATVNISNYKAGMYLVKVGGETVKVVKR